MSKKVNLWSYLLMKILSILRGSKPENIVNLENL